ncbi:MAG: hypothetical protein A3F74_02120 [Betaproteobacteria bacterium RIFCSPLOWO2_12_FULL_62_58]|nr:MAG: hypothetical protein A3F74_02120 [Betaproteobacteria bacterium RIFCSPLOWO2_12_FULL_62_58]
MTARVAMAMEMFIIMCGDSANYRTRIIWLFDDLVRLAGDRLAGGIQPVDDPQTALGVLAEG